MLRLLVAVLLVANLLFFTWSRGWLDSVVGSPAHGDREPQRLASQVRPELVTLWPKADAASAPYAASAASAPDSAAAASAPGSNASAVTVMATASSVTPGVAQPASAPASASASGPGTARSAVAAAPSSAATPASAAAATALACLETGPFSGTDLTAVTAAVRAALPAGSWTERKAEGTGEWMIYMGPYPDREWLERKKGELSRIRGGVSQEDVNAPPELARGISLGRFASQAAANSTLIQYRNRGIRTARVVRVGTAPAGSYLRVDQADAALASRVTALKLPLAGRSFTPCPK